jgi:Tfp pilus assembly protein PilX
MGPMMKPRCAIAARPPRRTEGGFMLVVAMVIMIIMTLSSIAMVTSLRGGISAAANIAFRQAATRTADIAVDSAYQWVANQMLNVAVTALDNNVAPANTAAATATPRYYATMTGVDTGCLKSGTTFTPSLYRFSDTTNGGDGFPCAGRVANNPAGYTLYYVVHRMANNTGACPGAGCMAPPLLAGGQQEYGGSKDVSQSDSLASANNVNAAVYYRITVKVVGPRQNNRYIQGFVY